MFYTVDRTEGDTAVLIDEEGRSFDVKMTDLPPVREGDILEKTSEGYGLCPQLTRSRREINAKRTRALFDD